MSDTAAPLTPEEIKKLRSILGGLSAAEWRALKAIAAGIVGATGGASGGRGSSGNAPNGQGDELPDSFLDSQAWTDMTVRKDPKRWAGASMVGLNYSDVPSEWHEVQAAAMEWKAEKGRQDATPKLQTKGKGAGKPWHEADAFHAKVCRAWARRNKGKTLPPPGATGAPSNSGTPVDDSAPTDFTSGNDADENWVPT